jgi:hypothetical protein
MTSSASHSLESYCSVGPTANARGPTPPNVRSISPYTRRPSSPPSGSPMLTNILQPTHALET